MAHVEQSATKMRIDSCSDEAIATARDMDPIPMLVLGMDTLIAKLQDDHADPGDETD